MRRLYEHQDGYPARADGRSGDEHYIAPMDDPPRVCEASRAGERFLGVIRFDTPVGSGTPGGPCGRLSQRWLPYFRHGARDIHPLA